MAADCISALMTHSIRIPLLFALFTLPLSLTAQDTFCLRNRIRVDVDFNKIYTALQVEHRTQECCFVRPVAGYRFTPWLKGDVGYEYRWKYSNDVKQRGLLSLTGTLNSGNLSLSVRERYVMDFTRRDGSTAYDAPTHILRSMIKAKCRIPESMFSPYVSTEAFTWETWNKVRMSAGTLLDVNERCSFDIYYMYCILASRPADPQHILGVNYRIGIFSKSK